jgi:uncharacterized protein
MTDGLTDAQVADVLDTMHVIALVGYSEKEERPSNRIAKFLKSRGYRVIPVNPGLAGQEALDEVIVGSLSEIPAEFGVDTVDIFRASEAVPGIVAEALTALPALQTVWMQLGVISEEAAVAARAAGKTVIMDRCPKIEIPRLGLE